MTRLFALLLLITAPSMSSAQAPMSAIGWLSDSLNEPPPSFEFRIDPTPLIAPITPQIEVTFVSSEVSPDAIGILAPALTGLPANLWGDMTADAVANMIRNFPTTGTPEGKSLFQRILLAQANPTFDVSQNGAILQARIERLFEMGAIEEAEALVNLTQPLPHDIFDIAFKVAIISDRTTQVCNALKAAPALSPDISARIYCLARSGDWNAAAMTLSLSASIGMIDHPHEEMLVRYLDPELFEGEPDPTAPDPFTTMDFVLREAVFLPRPNNSMPLPYIYRDIEAFAPLRAQIEASERLVKAGSMPPKQLFAAYRNGIAASSGGVWGRKNAVDILDKALEEQDAAKIIAAALTAAKALEEVGLLHAMAIEYGEHLATLAHDGTDTDNKILALAHMAGVSAGHSEGPQDLSVQDRLAGQLVMRNLPQNTADESTLTKAIVQWIRKETVATTTSKRLHGMLENGNHGQAILAALELLSNGANGDPEDIRTGLQILSTAGQQDAARRIAVQILLLE